MLHKEKCSAPNVREGGSCFSQGRQKRPLWEEEFEHGKRWEITPGRGNSKCKGPEVEISLMSLRSKRVAGVASVAGTKE